MYKKKLSDATWEWFTKTYRIPQEEAELLVWHCVKNGVITYNEVYEACHLIVEHTNEKSFHTFRTLLGQVRCLITFTREGMSPSRAAEMVVIVVNAMK